VPNIVIKGVPPYDGEYPLDLEGLTNGELHQIKLTSGTRAGEIEAELKRGDVGTFVAICERILKRHGHPNVNTQLLWDAQGDCFDVVDTDEEKQAEDDARPPDSLTNGGLENEPVGGA
jgi:hypothetical protein